MADRIVLLVVNAGNDDHKTLELRIPAVKPKEVIEISKESSTGIRTDYEQQDGWVLVKSRIGQRETKSLIIHL